MPLTKPHTDLIKQEDNVFSRVVVDYLVKGNARVYWEMSRRFTDPEPYEFELFYSLSNTTEPDDFESISTSYSPVAGVSNQFYIDEIDEKRLFGKSRDIVYRVALTTSRRTYYSRPAITLGQWDKRDFLLAKEIIRRERLLSKLYTGVEGYFLKARRFGPPCTHCLDPITGDCLDGKCEFCFGTAIIDGYYAPVPSMYAMLTNENAREHRDHNFRGTTKDVTIAGRFFDFPLPIQGDVWVNRYSDERYYIHKVEEKAVHRGIPLVWDVELRQAEMTDIVYDIDISALATTSGGIRWVES